MREKEVREQEEREKEVHEKREQELQKKFLLIRAAFLVVLLEKFPTIKNYIEHGEKQEILKNLYPAKWPVALDEITNGGEQLVLLGNENLTEIINSCFSEKFDSIIKNNHLPTQKVEWVKSICREINELSKIELDFITNTWLPQEIYRMTRNKLERYKNLN